MKISNQSAELDLGFGDAITLTGDQAGGLRFRVTLTRVEESGRNDEGQRWRQALANPVVVSVRLDGFGLLAMARRALTSRTKKCKAGSMTVTIVDGQMPGVINWTEREAIP